MAVSPRRPRLRRSLASRFRDTSFVIVAGTALGSALFAAGKYFDIRALPWFGAATAGPKNIAADEAIYTGSIVYMPPDGRMCWQLLFDNRTGQLTDKGRMDCMQAIYGAGATPMQMSAARVRVISDGFRRH